MRALLAGLTGVVLLTAGCGVQSAAGTQGAGQALPVQSPAGLTGPRPTMPTVTPSQSSPSTHTTELAPPVVPGLTWRPQGRRVNGVPVTYVASTAAGHVSLMWMDVSRLHFRLVAGAQVPEGAPTAPADRRPATWVGRMAAAFNGGFWLRDHAGGFVYDGQVVRRLLNGFASIVITTSGALNVEAWAAGTPTAGLVTVRQNLEPVIVDHRIQPTGQLDAGGWAVPSKGSYVANRSALAQLDDGSLVYLFGYHVTPQAVARSLVAVGAKTAMMLDMNGSWPMAFTYTGPRGAGGEGISAHEYHGPAIYLQRYRKDFVVASA